MKVRDIAVGEGVDSWDLVSGEYDESYATVCNQFEGTFESLFTDAGKTEFARVLDAECRAFVNGPRSLAFAVYGANEGDVGFLTYALAGYISNSKYNKWFTDGDSDE